MKLARPIGAESSVAPPAWKVAGEIRCVTVCFGRMPANAIRRERVRPIGIDRSTQKSTIASPSIATREGNPMRFTSLVATVCISAAASAQKPEPKYEGRPVAYWLERFEKANDEKDRKAAEVAVAAFGPDGATAVPTLMVMLDDRSARYREQVANMLCGIGPGAKAAVPDLIKMLEPKSPRDPHQVIRILCAIGPDAGDSVPAIRRVVHNYLARRDWRDGPPYFLFPSEYEFDKLGSAAVPLLLDLVDGANIMRKDALQALRRLGPEARAAAPRLAELLKDDESPVRAAAAETLWAVGKDPRVVPALAALLKADDPGVAWTAANTLGEIGPFARDALPALRAFLPKDDSGPAPFPIEILAGGTPTDIRSAYDAARSAIRKIGAQPKQ